MLTNDSIEDLTRKITDLEKEEDKHRAKGEYRWNPMADLERQQRGQVHRDRARLYAEQKEFDKAVVDYQAAISLGCDNSWVYDSLGAAYYGLGRYQDAGEAYKSALAKLRYENRGTDYFSRYEEKVASCGIQQALLDYHNGAIDPLGLQVRINGALWSLPDDGRDSVLWRSSRENPQDVAAQILAFLLPRFLSVGDLKLIPLIQADPDEVEKLAGWICPLESWPEEEPSESRRRALLLIAIAQYEAGDQELVEDWVKKDFRPPYVSRPEELSDIAEHPVLLLSEGHHLKRLGDLMGAIEVFEKLNRIYPNHPFALHGKDEVLTLAPKAIEQHLARQGWRAAALLAEKLGDFAGASRWHEKAAAVAAEKSENVAAAEE